MRSEIELKALLLKMRLDEGRKDPIHAPGAPQRRTMMETRAYDEGRLAMLEFVVDEPVAKSEPPAVRKAMPGEA